MSSCIKIEIDCNDVDFGSFQGTENRSSKDETKLSSDESMVHSVNIELLQPDIIMHVDSIKEEEFNQQEMAQESACLSECVTRPEVVWFTESETIGGEENLEEECDAYSMEYKGLLITPKLEGNPLPSCEERYPTFQESLLEHSGKLQVLQDDLLMKPPSKEEPDWNLSEEEEIPGHFMDHQCGQDLNVKKQSKDHLQVNSETDTDEDHFKCNFRSRKNLQGHLRLHAYEKTFECNQCNKTFSETGSLKRHLRMHTGEKPFKCSQCNLRFSRKDSLQLHLKMHTGEKPFECSQCNKKFSGKGILRKHLMTHNEEKPYECDHCHMKFNQPGNLQSHLKIHMGEKPFECNHCNKRFNRNGDLQRHLRIHSGEKPFECSQCNRKFSRKEDLQRHLRIHSGERTFECNQCDKNFIRKGDLRRHLWIHTGLDRDGLPLAIQPAPLVSNEGTSQ